MPGKFLYLIVGGLLGLLFNPFAFALGQNDNDQWKIDESDSAASELSEAELMEAMTLTSRAFRQAAGRVAPSLVTIESYGGVSAVQGRIEVFASREKGIQQGSLFLQMDTFLQAHLISFKDRL